MTKKIWLIVLAALALFASACGGGGDDADDGASDDGSADSSDDESTSDGSTEILFESDFSVVCNGAGVSAARGYTEGEPVTHMVGMAGEAPDYNNTSTMLSEQWRAPFDELADTQVVVCADRTGTTEGELCSGYEDDDISWEVMTFGASYDISVRDANTGDELQSTSVEVDPDSCPIFSSYTEGDPSPKPDYATPDAALEALLAPLATGEGAEAASTTVADAETDAPTTTSGGGPGDELSRDEAIGQLVDVGGFSQEEAECVVDGTIDEYGEFVTDPTPEQEAVLGQLLVDCAQSFGVGDNGSGVELGDGPDTPAPGTDAALDVLWNECAAGDPGSCDTLYFQAPVDSDYEQFGFSCGYRTEAVLDCTTLMNG